MNFFPIIFLFSLPLSYSLPYLCSPWFMSLRIALTHTQTHTHTHTHSDTDTHTHTQAALHECLLSSLLFSSHSFTPISISPLPLTHFYYCHRSLSLTLAVSFALCVCSWAALYRECLADRHSGEEWVRRECMRRLSEAINRDPNRTNSRSQTDVLMKMTAYSRHNQYSYINNGSHDSV